MAESAHQVYTATFRTMVTHLAQQRMPRFAMHTLMHRDVTGDRDTFDQMSATADKEITGERFTAATLTDPDLQRRSNWVRTFEWREGFTSQDQVSWIIDPQREYVKSAVYAMVRRKDELVLEAALGTAFTGKNGETPVVFNTADYLSGGQVITVGGPMTEEFMRILREAFDLTEEMLEDMEDGDRDAFCFAISPTVHRQLLNEVQTTSRDFYMDPVFGQMPLVNGRIPFFMGFRIRISNRLPAAVANVQPCIAWHRSALGMSTWREMRVKVAERDDLTGIPVQVVVQYSCNATRLRETAVFRVDVDVS